MFNEPIRYINNNYFIMSKIYAIDVHSGAHYGGRGNFAPHLQLLHISDTRTCGNMRHTNRIKGVIIFSLILLTPKMFECEK